MKNYFKILLPHIVAIILFLTLSFVYFNSAFNGKALNQSDMIHFKGMSKELVDFRERTGEEALWSNNMFGGMPAYLTSTRYTSNKLQVVHQAVMLFQARPFHFLIIALVCSYLAFLIFGVNPWVSMIGAIAFGFSSYHVNIIEAGHTSKMYAISYLPVIVASVYYSFKKNLLFGGILTALFLGLQIKANHLQITYYTLYCVLFLGVVLFIDSIKYRKIFHFLKTTLVLLLFVSLAIGCNLSNLWTTYEYGKYSIRGKSELTLNKDVKTKSGLDRDYIKAFSLGKLESLSVLIPQINGGGKPIGKDSEFYKLLKRNGVPNAIQLAESPYYAPNYWGPQSWTKHIYFGAIIIFLFVFGLFILKGPVKWWLLSVTILSFLLAWGKHFNFLTDFFIDFIPGYNKFRTVSMILVIAEFSIPVLGILAINELIKNNIKKSKFIYAIKWSVGIVGGICLLFAIIPGAFMNFDAQNDQNLVANLRYPQEFIDALLADRKALVVSDAWRSLFYVIIGAGLIVAFYFKKLKLNYFLVFLGIFILIDLWIIDKRILNDDDFVRKKEMAEPYKPTAANLQIMQDNDPYFRVINLTLNPFTDASTSYFHKSIGGYHGAKMKRYQDLIEYHISKQNMDVLNMLNTKYFIINDQNQQPQARLNNDALGNAWFVDSIHYVESADEEILALNNFDPSKIAILDKKFISEIEEINLTRDDSGSIKLTSYAPNKLIYKTKLSSDQIAVFSEIYYPKGWNAYIDGNPTNYFRVNYVLRAMKIPAGSKEIVFEFKPKSYFLGEKISLASSLILILLFVLTIIYELKKYFNSNIKSNVS